VTGEQVFANPAGIAGVRDSAGPRIHLNRWSGDVMQLDVATDRMDVQNGCCVCQPK
jgi:hypothetical protein